jgi:hypothetical protein
MAIDDPKEKIADLAKEQAPDFLGTALQLGGMAEPLFKVVAIARDFVQRVFTGDPIRIAILSLCDELRRLEEKWPTNFDSAMENTWFKRAVIALMDESIRAPNDAHVRLLARATAQGCFPAGGDISRREDLANYVHDLAQLSVEDIRFLKLIRDAFRQVRIGHHDGYAGHFDNYKSMAEEAGFDPDDRIALGARLAGFGLVYEPLSPPFPGEHFVRITKRGVYLLGLLEAAELPIEKQN